MTVDDVFDSAVEKKSPLILNHIADGNYNCDPPSLMMRYYNCHGKGVLEAVETYEDERIEPRDPPPPMQDLPKIAEDESVEGETAEDETRDPAISNGLLAEARCGTASSVILEAGKQQEVEGDVSEDTAVLVAAAAKWRIAKELHIVRSSFSTESEQVFRDRYSVVRDESHRKETDEKIVALPTDAEVAAAATKQSEEALRDRYSVVHDESTWDETDEKIAAFPPIENNRSLNTATNADCSSTEEAFRAHKHLLDPPGDHRAENYAIENEQEQPTHYNDENNEHELPGHDEEQNQLLPIYARTLSVSLKQLEKQQFTNQSRLSEQRLRLERRKKHRMQRQQTTKASLPI